jgi:hypothetical protein
MIPSPELLLVAVVVLFYLHDSATLLYCDEFVLHEARGRWHASVGGLQWRGRFLYLPNPFAPWRAHRRCSWLAGSRGQPGSIPAPAESSCRWPMQVGVAFQAVLLLFVLPLLLWRFPHPLALLALLVLVYATALVLAWLAWRGRARIGLDARALAWIAFDCLACPPHSINLVRRLGMRSLTPVDTGAVVEHVRQVPARRRLAMQLVERIALLRNDGRARPEDARLDAFQRNLQTLAT